MDMRPALTRRRRSPPTSPLLIPHPYQVVDKTVETPARHGTGEVVTLTTKPVEGELPPFRPGQVSMVGAFGVGEAAISISSATSDRDVHAYTIRRVGPISGALVETPIGGVVTIRGPFGRPWPVTELDTPNLIIIGGGLGMAPLRAVINEAVELLTGDGANPPVRLAVVNGARNPDQILYRNEVAAWRRDGAEVTLTVDTVSDDGGAERNDRAAGAERAGGAWAGPVGLIPDALALVDLDWAATTAFVCGPEPMMRFTAGRLLELGVDTRNIWLTLERNMQCGNALCGHCQLGPFIVCRDGPVVRYPCIARFLDVERL